MHRAYTLPEAFGRAELFLRIEDIELARATLEAIGMVTPDAARLHLFRGWLGLAEGREAHALGLGADVAVHGSSLAAKHFRLALGRDPLEPLAWHGLAAALPDGKEQMAAAGHATRLASSEAVADLRRGKPYLARAPLELLRANHPLEQEWTLLLVECLRRLGELDAARGLLAPLLHRVPLAAPAALLAAALAHDETTSAEFLLEASRGDPAWITARRLWAPEKPPIVLPRPPEVMLPDEIEARVNEIGERPVLLDNGEWRMAPLPPSVSPPPPKARRPRTSAEGPSLPQPASPAQGAGAGALAAKGKNSGTGAAAAPGDGASDVVDVIREVQRATQRLFGQTPVPLATGETAALLVTHRGSLLRRYGQQTVEEIERRMDRLLAALGERGIVGRVLMVDQGSSGRSRSDAAEADPRAVSELIQAARKQLEASNLRLDTILIVGGDSVIPFHRLPNPSQDADDAVCSDNPYGSESGSVHVPDIVVARLPDGGADKGELLLALLQRSIEYHEGWLISQTAARGMALPLLRRLVEGTRAKRPIQAWGATTESWREPSDLIYREFQSDRPLYVCPPAGPETLDIGGVGDLGKLLFFNLHGLSGGPNWYGQAANASPDDPLPVALTPNDVGELEPATICFTEACFGAEVMARSVADSMPLRLLDRGALAFIGSTATAYGSVGLPLGGADILAQQVFMNLRRGQPIGRALLLARDWLARETVERQGYLDPDDAKTLLSFVLLGDPWATPYAKPVMQAKLGLPAIVPIIAQRRPVQMAAIPAASTELVQKLVAKVAPQFAHARITALGQGRPDRIAKGQAGALVFSAAADVTTVDGRRLEQIARITLSHGTARKVLLTR